MRTVTALCLGTASAFMATSAHKPKLAARKATETLPEGEFEYRVAILGDLHVHGGVVIHTSFMTERRDAGERFRTAERDGAAARDASPAPTPEHASYPRRSTRATWTIRWRAGST